jgi:hypothetical protein
MSEWQPIETAPQNGEWVLLCGGKDWYDSDQPDAKPCVVARFEHGEWFFGETNDVSLSYQSPTHWKPLDTPPEKGGCDE